MKQIAILSVSLLLLLAGAALSPVLLSIGHSYPDVSPVVIKSLVTIPSICVIVVNLVMNAKNIFVSQKQQLLVGLIIYSVGGLLPLMHDSFSLLLCSRVILGIGLGCIATPAIGVINSQFEGEKKQAMLGLAGSMNNLGTVIAVLFAGFVSANNWENALYIYTLAIISFVLVLCFLPSDRTQIQKAKTSSTTITEKQTKSPIFIYSQMLFATVIYFIIPTNLSMYISQKFMYSGSWISGVLMAVVSIAGVASGLFFKRIYQKVSKSMGLFIFLLFAFSMYGMSLAPTILVFVIGLMISGFVLGLALPYFNSQLIASTTKSKQNQALAVGTSMIFIGQFISPFIIDGLLHILPVKNAFTIGAIIALVCMLYHVFYHRVSSTRSMNQQSITNQHHIQ